MSEEKLVYDELVRQGWTEEQARIASRQPKSLPYAQARFAAHAREFVRVCTREFEIAARKINEAWRKVRL